MHQRAKEQEATSYDTDRGDWKTITNKARSEPGSQNWTSAKYSLHKLASMQGVDWYLRALQSNCAAKVAGSFVS